MTTSTTRSTAGSTSTSCRSTNATGGSVSTARFVVPSASRRTRELASPESQPGRVPRVARLMALAIKFQGMLADGSVRNQAELAAVGHVTRARLTQILNLTHLAPDLQEAVLYLPVVSRGRDPISEGHLRPIAAMMDWDRQRVAWARLRSGTK